MISLPSIRNVRFGRQLAGSRFRFTRQLYHGGIDPEEEKDAPHGGTFPPLTHFGTRRAAWERIRNHAARGHRNYRGRDLYVFECRMPRNVAPIEIDDYDTPRPQGLARALKEAGLLSTDDWENFTAAANALDAELVETDAERSQGPDAVMRSYNMDLRRMLAAVLQARGIQAFCYRNEVEHRGAMSWLLVDCSSVEIVGRTLVRRAREHHEPLPPYSVGQWRAFRRRDAGPMS